MSAHHNIVKKSLIIVLSLQIVVMQTVYAFNLPKPSDRWGKSAGSVSGNLPDAALPDALANELPDANPEIKVGDVVVDKNGNRMTVTQTTDRALIDWDSFNIGQKNTVEFKQPGVDSLALNRIYQNSPSKIFGSLKANGNVWLFNSNGIFFGEGSQVDVRGMIASTLEFNGLDANNFATEDIFGAINQGKPFLNNAQLLTGDGTQLLPRIIIEEGAVIKSNEGGPLLFAAPEVINAGSVTADEGGQVVMAASKQDVYLALTSKDDSDLRGFLVEVDSGVETVAVEVAENEFENFEIPRGAGEVVVTDSNGQEHTVQAPAAGAVVNAGDITANFGNITLVASEIVQAGQLRSSTAVDVNGSIRIIARDGSRINAGASGIVREVSSAGKSFTAKPEVDALYFDNAQEMPDTDYYAIGQNPGTVIMQADSSVDIAIDSSDKTANDSLAQSRSKIIVEGKTVFMDSNASIVAPSGEVSIRARANPLGNLDAPEQDSDANFIMGKNALIDVSGTENTVLEAERNTLEFFITSNELKDAPQQKGGVLLRETVKVDIREGTPLFDWQAGLAAVEKTASERAAAGGSIDVRASAIELDANATLDVSGGKVHFEGGDVESSSLISGSEIINIADADATLPYNSVVLGQRTSVFDSKWGKRPSYRQSPFINRYYRDAYDHGSSAGDIHIEAAQQYYDESTAFKATTLVGPYQRQITAQPKGGSLGFSTGVALTDIAIFSDINAFADDLLSESIVLLTEQLEASGASNIEIETNGLIQFGSEQASAQLRLSGNGSNRNLVLAGRSVDVNGDIRAVATDVTLNQRGTSEGVLRLNGLIDTSGNWSNDFALFSTIDLSAPVITDAGQVTLQADREIIIEESSAKKPIGIIANAGAWLDQTGELIIGAAGDISITNTGFGQLLEEAAIRLDGLFSAVDGGAGGLLSIDAKNVTLGGDTTSLLADLVIGDDFFKQASVGGVNLTANNGNAVISGQARINLAHQQYLIPRADVATGQLANATLRAKESADSVAGVLDFAIAENELAYLAAPGRLHLTATRLSDISAYDDTGIVAIEKGAIITGSAGSAIELDSQNRLLIDGDINLAGGSLIANINQTLEVDNDAGIYNYILIGDNAAINLSAKALPISNPSLENRNRIVQAGSVELNANIGSVIVSQGANITLAGTVVESSEYSQAGNGLVNKSPVVLRKFEEPVAAGSFTLFAEKGYAIDSVIDFGSGDVDADGVTDYRGGSIDLTLAYGSDRRKDSTAPTIDRLEVALGDRSGLDVLEGFSFNDALPLGFITSVNTANKVTGTAKGFINSANLTGNHLNSLVIDSNNSYCCALDISSNADRLQSLISVTGDVAIAADASVVLDDNWMALSEGSLSVTAPYVQLGESTNIVLTHEQLTPQEENQGLVAGNGFLHVVAGLVDLIGNFTLTGASETEINAAHGVRTRSVIDRTVGDSNEAGIATARWTSFGNLEINAPVVWSATLSDYVFDLRGYEQKDESDNVIAEVKGKILVAPYRDSMGNALENNEAILSYGGSLNLEADEIKIDSRLQQPYGEINLVANDALLLTENSVLSVAAVDDTAVPFGRIQASDLFWIYPLANIPFRYSTNPEGKEKQLAEKLIRLSAPNITAEQGSEQNLSGGGKVFAREFVAGLGGTQDILSQQSYSDRFVLVKNFQSGFAPYDPVEFSGSDIPWGSTLEMTGSKQLPDGVYTVLPASYAFLQDAYLLTPTALGITPYQGFATKNNYGAEVVAGRFGNASITGSDGDHASAWQAFTVEPGFKIVEGSSQDLRAEYNIAFMDEFFAASAPGVLPIENGRLSINVAGDPEDALALAFAGKVRSSQQSPIGSSLDISSSAAEIVIGKGEGPLVIDANQIAKAGAESILIGGERAWSTDEQSWQINTTANRILLDGATLTADELLLTASDQLALVNGAVIDAAGETSFTGNRWRADDEVVTLLASAGKDSQLLLNEIANYSGSLLMDDSRVVTRGALGIIYDGATAITGADIQAGRLQVATEQLSIGEHAGDNLDRALLTGADTIELQAGDAILFNDDLSIVNGVDHIALTAAQLTVASGKKVHLQAAETLRLQGDEATDEAGTSMASELILTAKKVLLGSDDSDSKSLAIDAEVSELNASQVVVAEGDIDIHSSGDMGIKTPLMAAADAVRVGLSSAGSMLIEKFQSSSEKVTAWNGAPASIFELTANDLTLDTSVISRSGMLNVVATGGDITLGENALIDVSGFAVKFPDQLITAPAGAVALNAAGDIRVANAAAFKFGDTAEGGEGGELALRAQGNLMIDSLSSIENNSGAGHNLIVEAQSVDIAAISKLNQSGFDGKVAVLVNGSDEHVTLDDSTAFTAKNLTVAVQRGELTLADGASLAITAATEDAVFYAGEQLQVLEGANIRLRSGKNDNAQRLALQSLDGAVIVEKGADFELDGGLEIVKSIDDQTTQVDVGAADDTDRVVGNIDFYLARSFEDADIQQADVDNYAGQIITVIEDAAFDVSEWISTALDVVAKPLVDIYANTDISMGNEGELYEKITIKNILNLATPVVVERNPTSFDSFDDVVAEFNTPQFKVQSIERGFTPGEAIDLAALRANGNPGRLQVRATGDIDLQSGLGDGVGEFEYLFVNPAIKPPSPPKNPLPSVTIADQRFTSILLENDSWDLGLFAGANTDARFAAIDTRARQLKQSDINLQAGTFVRTGTGDIRLQSAGDLNMRNRVSVGNWNINPAMNLVSPSTYQSYVAALGRADYKVDTSTWMLPNHVSYTTINHPVLGRVTFPTAVNFGLVFDGALPSWGDRPFSDIWFVLPDFSGVSEQGGSVAIDLGGSMLGLGGGQTPNDFIQSIVSEDYAIDFAAANLDYTDTRARVLAIDEFRGGVHAVGGGAVTVNVAGNIENMSISTPGLTAGNDGSDNYSLQSGGNILTRAFGDILGSAFSNDGASVSVRAFGSLAETAESVMLSLVTSSDEGNALQQVALSPTTFLSGSDTRFDLLAGRDLLIDGIANTTMLPAASGQASDLSFRAGADDDIYGNFFDGYDHTSLNLSSIGGEVNFTGNNEAIAAFLGENLINNLIYNDDDSATDVLAVLREDQRFSLLPSQVAISSLYNTVEFGDSLTLFPSANMQLAVRAGQSINISSSAGSSGFYLYMPEFSADILPSVTDVFSGDNINDSTQSVLSDAINPAGLDNINISQNGLLDRSEADLSRFYAMQGSIGGSDPLRIYSVKALDVFAGENVVNTAFIIQHGEAGDISKIRADNDIYYDLNFSGNIIQDGGELQIIEVRGPGDLIVSAGNNIDFAASTGVVATGNLNNPAMDENRGASVHIYAGYDENKGNFSALLGNGLESNKTLSGVNTLGLSEEEVSNLTLSQWFELLAESTDDEDSVFINAVSSASGERYASVEAAIEDWRGFENDMQLRVSVTALKQLVQKKPELAVQGGELLFGEKPADVKAFSSMADRKEAFAGYWDVSAGLIALEKLLHPDRVSALLQQLPEATQLADLPISQQLTMAVSTFATLDDNAQLIVAEHIVNEQLKQSGVEAFAAGRGVVSFERGFVALKRFFGENLDAALAGAALRINTIKSGNDSYIKPEELNFGEAEDNTLTSFAEVARFWSQSSGEDFNEQELAVLESADSLDDISTQQLEQLKLKYGSEFSLDPSSLRQGEVNLVFSAIRTQAPGANINFMLPTGQVDVGLSAELVRSLGVKTQNGQVKTNELGVIAEYFGDINAVVASGFNVNESRTFSLAGGTINQWATWGDIDAGKGAKTAVSTPEADFVVNQVSGAITKTNSPSVSGSGIKTDLRSITNSSALPDSERFYEVASGAGPIFLATPLGVVDAGEAGIESAGDLFLSAITVRGADNINVGGISVGVATSSPVSTSLAGSGDAASQASDAATDSVSGAAARDAANSATAFITIELLDTGIGSGAEL